MLKETYIGARIVQKLYFENQSRLKYHQIVSNIRSKATGLTVSDPKTKTKTFIPFKTIKRN